MGIIIALIIGGIIGWLAGLAVGRDEGIVGSVVIGIIGAIIGSVIARAFGAGSQSYLAFSWTGVLWSFIGAVIFAGILSFAQGRSHHVS